MLDARVRGAFATVEQLYKRAGADLCEPPGTPTLAVSLLGPAALEYSEYEQTASLSRDALGWHISVSPDLDDEEMCFAIAWQIARWATDRKGPNDMLGYVAAGLALPPSALSLAVGKYGWGTDEIVRRYKVPKRVVLLQRRVCYRPSLAYAAEPPPRSGEYPRNLTG